MDQDSPFSYVYSVEVIGEGRIGGVMDCGRPLDRDDLLANLIRARFPQDGGSIALADLLWTEWTMEGAR